MANALPFSPSLLWQPLEKVVVFPTIVMTTTIHMRYEERNLYRVLVWEVKNMTNKPRLEVRLVWLASWPGCVGPTACPGKHGPLEALPWAWALSCPG
ncbi:unnamed protein product [Prunus armeniaca]